MATERTVRVYCAGKIRKCGDWRPAAVRCLSGSEFHEANSSGIILDSAIDEMTVTYVGPFAYACDHGCSHGPTCHGNGLDIVTCQGSSGDDPVWDNARVEDDDGWPLTRAVLFRVNDRSWLDMPATADTIRAAVSSGTEVRCGRCRLELGKCQCARRAVYERSLRQIDCADLFIARPEVDSFGTLLEIGYAAQAGKVIVVDLHGQPSHLAAELWFATYAHNCVDHVLEDVATEILGHGPDKWGSHARPAARPDPQEALCESPIEVALYRAMRAIGLKSIPQVEIDRYRADFVIGKIVIECDGHNYHSSREQRTRDAGRDRALTAAGYRVIRFTGTEIHADAARCARDVHQIVNGST